MKKKLFKSLRRAFPVVLLSLGLFSCDKLIDVQPDNALEQDQFYQDKFDADAAVIGIYGKFLNLAEHHIILNELRADLMAVTPAARESMVQLSQHTVTPDNVYADPRPFYELIVNCNDVLTNFDRMKDESKMSQADYAERYSDIAALRCWLYLQLAIHYGNVPYFTEPLAKITDITNLTLSDLSRFDKFTLDQMIDELIRVMEALPYEEQYSPLNSLNRSIDGYNTRKFFINKRVLMGDLYLWKGEYLKAAEQYKTVMETPTSVTGASNEFDSYKIKWADVTNHNDLSVGYVRYADQDVTALIDNNTQGWKSMFIRPMDGLFNEEWIWALPFDYTFGQKTPFVKLFSNVGGDYLVKPSQHAIDLWESQVQRNGFPWDQRGRWSWKMQNGQPVVMKHIYNFDPVNPLQTNGKWFLYRAALLHLRFAEAANRDNQHKIAWALLNNGGAAFDDPDITDVREELDTFEPFPYNFAFRSTNTPYFRDIYHRSAGIRGRANLTYLSIPGGISSQDSTIYIENKIIEEAALELAFEGHRWGDLVRIAKRRNDPAFLADKVYAKLVKAGNPNADAVRAKLMHPQNWFLPFRME
ncbi:RagB/SusD family nutrient uptake outer membrane protein [Botryobacter ruber]|uniref:RagB/SusD family nutrient uptake outer membrane protein n=1 Tax=Botryobacter ruber TaxID=2171629 RepID=UPI000E0C0680|nr:RagB/SusD family nutrient uptake outer membrane protein [Botryobacter ruber]